MFNQNFRESPQKNDKLIAKLSTCNVSNWHTAKKYHNETLHDNIGYETIQQWHRNVKSYNAECAFVPNQLKQTRGLIN